MALHEKEQIGVLPGDGGGAPRGRVRSDGETLHSSLAAAVQAANETITIGPGTFQESVTIDTADFLVQGSGKSTVIDGGTSDGLHINAPDVVVKDLTAKTTAGGGSNAVPFRVNGNNAEIAFCKIPESDSEAVFVDGADEVTVSHTFIGANVDTDGVDATGVCRSVTVSNCSVIGVNGYGLALGGTENRAVSNYVRNTSNDALVLGGPRCVGVGNTIRAAGDYGISLDGSTDARVIGCAVHNSTTGPLYLGTASGHVLDGNYPKSINNSAGRVAASGTVTLSSGSAVVSTGITTTGTSIDVALDPSGGGANAADVKASARAFWDNSAGEYKVEILEDGTSVGNPDIGYRILQG